MNQAEERQAKPVIRTIQATRSELTCADVAQNYAGPQVLAVTTLKIIYEDRKRDSLDRMLKGTLLGFGDDFFVMQDGESYLVYEDFVKIISHVPVSMGSFDGCKLHGFCVKLGVGTVIMLSKFGIRDIVLPEENLKCREMEMSDYLRTRWIRCPACNGKGKVHVMYNSDNIRRITTEHFDMTLPASMREANQVAIYLCKNHAGMTEPQIVETFGMTYADVIHACKVVSYRMVVEPESEFCQKVSGVFQQLACMKRQERVGS
jgi:hypothetical protein